MMTARRKLTADDLCAFTNTLTPFFHFYMIVRRLSTDLVYTQEATGNQVHIKCFQKDQLL